jgi:3-hydroxyisobutyrate dehydrogenase
MDDRTLPHVAFLGTGLMGRPMAGRLLAAGFPVTVWNRTIDKARPLAEQGAEVAPTPAAAMAQAEATVLMLADAPAIRATLLEGEAAGLLGGRAVIQMATIAPLESRELAAGVAARGGDYLEAPVLGSIAEATAGRLVVMVGASPELFERWLPLLRALGPEPRLIGPPGQAAALKLALNQLIATITTAYATGLGMVRRSGVDLDHWAEIVRASALYAPTFDKKLHRMVERDFTPANFPARLLLKDLRLVVDEATHLGLFTPFLGGLVEIVERAVATGFGEADYSALAAAVEPAAGRP